MSLRWVNLKRTSPPASEPVSSAELKSYLRVTHSDDDTLIASLGVAARELLEDWTRRSFITQTWRISFLNSFETGRAYMLPRPLLQAISSVQYVDTGGNTQTFAASNYHAVAGEDGAIWFEDLPDTDSVPEPILITYTAGYGVNASDVPEVLKTAIKIVVRDWYDNRSNEGTVPDWVKSIISNFRVPMS